MSRMSVGQYFPGDSLIHHLDARVKLFGLIVLIAAIILTDTIAGYCNLIVLTVGLIFLAKVKFTDMLGFLKILPIVS